MWAGYAFSVDFREERGHAYMLEDQIFTERQQVVQQPGTCLHCHARSTCRTSGSATATSSRASSDEPDAYQEARKHSSSTRSPASTATTPRRWSCASPARLHGGHPRAQGVRASPNYDVNRDATRQEMRTYVCGQCHVEYYFKGPRSG
jgi:nitrite reductase (cytochrome c-552)